MGSLTGTTFGGQLGGSELGRRYQQKQMKVKEKGGQASKDCPPKALGPAIWGRRGHFCRGLLTENQRRDWRRGRRLAAPLRKLFKAGSRLLKKTQKVQSAKNVYQFRWNENREGKQMSRQSSSVERRQRRVHLDADCVCLLCKETESKDQSEVSVRQKTEVTDEVKENGSERVREEAK